jgi:DNA-binding SARP family transcriptional activator/predicted ATPase
MDPAISNLSGLKYHHSHALTYGLNPAHNQQMATDLSLSFLGTFQVNLKKETAIRFESDKVRALLAYLAVERNRPHRRDTLAELLWPEFPPTRARRNLNQALLNLRQAIGDREAAPPFLLADHASIQFNLEASFWLDVAEFEAHLASAFVHDHVNPRTCSDCMDWRASAVALYRGDFLQGLSVDASTTFDEWLTLRRERLHRQAVEALVILARYHEDRWELETARELALRQVALEPWGEAVHRQLMRLFAHSGQRGAALMQYKRLQQILLEEFGTEPSGETKDLYDRISALNSEGLKPNLPPQLTSFLGRQTELAEAALILAQPDCRLLTITGPGGVGKTRLAVELARRVANRFLEGVHFVPLATLNPDDSLANAMMTGLQIPFPGSEEPEAQLFSYLQDKELLLLLDNFEHLQSAASLIDRVLQNAPEVKIVLTSRVRLHFPMETVFELGGLPVPQEGQVQDLESIGAAQLFIKRAEQARSDFVLTPSNGVAVSRICRLVGGLPLAIELAASWVRALSCAEIATEIEAGLSFLASPEDVPASYRSMQAVFGRSWQLLTRVEQATFSQLSLFRGGFTRRAAAEVAQATLQVLARLVDQSLLQRAATNRYQIHELLRQYAADKLGEAAPEIVDGAQIRMVGYFLSFATENQDDYLALEQESANLLAGMRLAHDRQMWAENMAYAALLSQAWLLRARFYDARQGYRWASEAAEKLGDVGRLAEHLRGWARACIEQGAYDEASTHLERSLGICQANDDLTGLASTLYYQGRIAVEEAEFETAQQLLGESRRLFREVGDLSGEAKTLYLEADVPFYRQEYNDAVALGRQALEIHQTLDDKLGCIRSLGLLADIALKQQQFEDGRDYCDQALVLCDQLQEQGERGVILYILAEALRHLGQLQGARKQAEESLGLFKQMGDRKMQARALWRLSQVDADLENYDLALVEGWQGDALYRQLADQWNRPYILRHLGDVYLATGQPNQAQDAWQQAMDLGIGPDHPEYGALQQRLAGLSSII